MGFDSFSMTALVLDLLFTGFIYLGIPLIITAIIFKKTKLVRADIIIIINAVFFFFVLSLIMFLRDGKISSVAAPFIWSGFGFLITKKIYGRNASKCPHCHKYTNTDPCELCGEPFKPLTIPPDKRIANVVLLLDRNGVESDWISFEVYLDNAPYFVSSVKGTRLAIPSGHHEVYYKVRGSKIPVVSFDVFDMNEVITITCMLLDKNHISASITDRSPRIE